MSKRDYLDDVLADKSIKPTHLETSLYVAALEVASRRGYPASEIRIYSPLPQFKEGGRWFDGRAWFFTYLPALIESIQEEARLYPLDLLAWREQPPPEEGIELLAVLRAVEHEWLGHQIRKEFGVSVMEERCLNCKTVEAISQAACSYELLQDNYSE